MIIWIALAFYGETEGQWFNSFLTNVGGYSDYHKTAMVSASAIVGTLAFLFWATISDNLRGPYGRRVPIYVAGALATALFVWLFGQSSNFWWLLVCDGFIIGFTSNMFHCTSRALVPDLFPKERRGKVNFFMQVGGFMGTFLIWGLAFLFLPEGGGQYARAQYDFVFALCAAFLAISAVTTFFLVREPRVTTPARKWTREFKLMFDRAEMGQHKDFLKLFVASLFVLFSTNAYKPWMLEILQEFSFTPDQLVGGVAIAAAIAAPVLIAYGTLVDRVGRKRMVLLALGVIPGACLLIAFSNYHFYVALVGLALLISFTVGLDVALSTWTQDLLAPESRAKFLGIINVGKAAGQVPGMLVAAVFSETYGTLSIFLVSACFMLVAIPFFTRVPETL